MENESSHIDNLIAKYLAGEASPVEQEELLKWMETSVENKKYFEGIEFVHNKAISSHRYIRVNTEKAWDTVSNKMDQSSQPSSIKSYSVSLLKSNWIRIAASILILVGIASVLYLNFSKPGSSASALTIASTNSSVAQTLPDSTKVVLNKHSKIEYRSDHSSKTKTVTITGEAFFDIKHIDDKKFIVETDAVFIRDVGTSFNVKAYPGDAIIEVYVEEGEVAFYSKDDSGITIMKGETGIYHKATKAFNKKSNENLNIVSYKTRAFEFRDAKLEEVLLELNSVNEETIEIANPALNQCRISVTFNGDETAAIADVIAETLGLQVTRTSNGYLLNGKSCNSQ